MEGLSGKVSQNDAPPSVVTDLEANTGRLVHIVGHVANVLGAFGEKLRAGEIIIAGSVVPPIFVQPVDRSVTFALEPVSSVSVRLSHTN
jgi:2-keto-4-pentenoate hydratase